MYETDETIAGLKKSAQVQMRFRARRTISRRMGETVLGVWPDSNGGNRFMPGEAKLGLMAGVGVVLAVALVFFKPATKPASASPARAQAAQRASLSPMLPPSAQK
jgi:hypothetical protein